MDYRVNGRVVSEGEKWTIIQPAVEEDRQEFVDRVFEELFKEKVKGKKGWVKGRKRKV